MPYPEFERRRARLVGTLHGRLLEIGAGSGANFDALAADAEWIGLEPDAGARTELDAAAAARGYPTPALFSPAESIPLESASMDAVLGTAVLCSVADPAAVLAEVCRVLRPGGRVVFAEHVAAPPSSFKRWLQTAATPLSVRLDHGCHWNRDTGALLEGSRLQGSVERMEITQGILPSIPAVLFAGTLPRAPS